VVSYRTFRNTDPPALADLWNESFTGRGAVRLSSSSPLEHLVFSKPYFDPTGLIVAVDAGKVVGFAHAGFAPDEKEVALGKSAGVLSLIAVRPSHRRQGVGTGLLLRCEAYLRGAGATMLWAGQMFPHNPFYFGLYGGSECSGALVSDRAAGPFLLRRGYRVERTYQVLQRSLRGQLNVADARFAALRRRFEFLAQPRKGTNSWWRECVLGLVELHDFCLEEKTSGEPVARASVWEMDGYSRSWNESALGLVELGVRPDLRRQGLARFLLAQMFRYLQDQYFSLVEVQVPETHEPELNLYRTLGFQLVDTGHIYGRAEDDKAAK
jgi:ribosomal protein S18 acetylase RimI-like enzyme